MDLISPKKSLLLKSGISFLIEMTTIKIWKMISNFYIIFFIMPCFILLFFYHLYWRFHFSFSARPSSSAEGTSVCTGEVLDGRLPDVFGGLVDHGGSGRHLPSERAGNETEVGGYAEAAGAAKKKSLFFSQKSCISMKGSYIILKDSYNYTILSVFLLFYFVLWGCIPWKGRL